MRDADEQKPFDAFVKHRLLIEAGRMLRFGLVGVGASATYILVALVFAHTGLSTQGANLIGVAASTTVSFLGHVFYSFRKGSVEGRYVLRFFLLSLAVYALSGAGTHAGVAWLGWPYWMVVFGVAAIIPLFTWTAGRFWVFR